MPGIVILAVFLILLFPDGRLPSHRWWPLAWAGAVILVVPTAILAVGYWPLRAAADHPGRFGTARRGRDVLDGVPGALLLGAISIVALVLRFRRAGAVQRQQIKWFAYGAALSIPLSLFP